MSFNSDQRDHMEWLAKQDPSTMCWCGWHARGECPRCPDSLTAADKMDHWCPECRSAPPWTDRASPLVHRKGCSRASVAYVITEYAAYEAPRLHGITLDQGAATDEARRVRVAFLREDAFAATAYRPDWDRRVDNPQWVQIVDERVARGCGEILVAQWGIRTCALTAEDGFDHYVAIEERPFIEPKEAP